jgi:hypothetical protein
LLSVNAMKIFRSEIQPEYPTKQGNKQQQVEPEIAMPVRDQVPFISTFWPVFSTYHLP